MGYQRFLSPESPWMFIIHKSSVAWHVIMFNDSSSLKDFYWTCKPIMKCLNLGTAELLKHIWVLVIVILQEITVIYSSMATDPWLCSLSALYSRHCAIFYKSIQHLDLFYKAYSTLRQPLQYIYCKCQSIVALYLEQKYTPLRWEAFVIFMERPTNVERLMKTDPHLSIFSEYSTMIYSTKHEPGN